jgi:phage baseplate assembly protein W
MGAEVTIQAFAFPLRLAGEDFIYTEQDTQAEIADCVKVLMLTEIGSRMVLPAYGIPPLFQGQVPVVTAEVLAAIQRWEPRAYASLSEYLDAVDIGKDVITVAIGGGQ